MALTLAFDVYGTLIDTAGTTTFLNKYVGQDAAAFGNFWREKQLEYSFRRGLMQNYQNFNVCTRHALDAAALHFKTSLSDDAKDELMKAYQELPAFSDVKQGLATLSAIGVKMFAFSNGLADDVAKLLDGAGISEYFQDVVSVDEVKTFKPSPAVYCHFLRRANSLRADTWLISSNPFDVIGAISAGWLAVWLNRSDAQSFEPWEIQPTATLKNLLKLEETIANYIQ